MGSLDLRSDYIDDCPWVSVTPHAPQGVRAPPDGSSSKDMVGEPANVVFQVLITYCKELIIIIQGANIEQIQFYY